MSIGDGVQAGARNEPVSAGGDILPAPPSPRATPSAPDRRWWHWLTEFPGLIVVVLLVAVLIRTFLVAPFYIPSQSMENTLRVGDRVLVDRVGYHFHPIHRGDIVVFNGLDSFTPEVTTTPPSNPVAKVTHSFLSALGILDRLLRVLI